MKTEFKLQTDVDDDGVHCGKCDFRKDDVNRRCPYLSGHYSNDGNNTDFSLWFWEKTRFPSCAAPCITAAVDETEELRQLKITAQKLQLERDKLKCALEGLIGEKDKQKLKDIADWVIKSTCVNDEDTSAMGVLIDLDD